MHELSIAMALIDLVRQHTPTGAVVRRVQVRAGPLRAIEPQAMQLAWQAGAVGTELANSMLDLETPPWTLSCPDCGQTWTSPDPCDPCPCGSARAVHTGSDDLLLVSIDVDEKHDVTKNNRPPRHEEEPDRTS